MMPLLLGGMIGMMLQILSEAEEREGIVADLNQALEQTGARYRLRAVE